MPLGKVCLLVTIVFTALDADTLGRIAQELRQGQILQSRGQFAEAEHQFAIAVQDSEASGRPKYD